MTTLTIIIHCHNRPAYAKLAIESVLHQTNPDFKLVISDNSNNDEMCDLVFAEFPNLDYRRRPSTLPALDHFNTNIAETETDFVCLFHDDDLMAPDYVDAMLKTIALHPQAAAYSCNADILNGDVLNDKGFFESDDPYITLENPRALAGRYFSRHPNGYAPFPAYIYRCSVVKKIPINGKTGGKYSDVTWLMEISKVSAIVWNTKKLMQYRIHETNDGGIESARERLRLLRYFKINRLYVGQSLINDYRFFLYKKYSKSGASDRQFSPRVIEIFRHYMTAYRLKRFLQSQTYAYVFYKIGKRFSKNHVPN